MKLSQFKNIIKEAVREAVREELNEILTSNKPIINEMKTFSFTTDNVKPALINNQGKTEEARNNVRNKMAEMFGFKTESQPSQQQVQTQTIAGENMNINMAALGDILQGFTPQELAALGSQQ